MVRAEEPLDKISVGDSELSIVRDLEEVEYSGFTKETITIDGKDQTIFVQGIVRLIVLIDEETGNQDFYQLNDDNQVLEVFNPLIINDVSYIIVEIEEEEQIKEGMSYEFSTINGHEVPSWSYDEQELSHLRLVYLSDLEGKLNYYLYDASQDVLIQFMDWEIVSGQEVEPSFFQRINETTLLAIGGMIMLGCGVAIVALIKAKRKNKQNEKVD